MPEALRSISNMRPPRSSRKTFTKGRSILADTFQSTHARRHRWRIRGLLQSPYRALERTVISPVTESVTSLQYEFQGDGLFNDVSWGQEMTYK